MYKSIEELRLLLFYRFEKDFVMKRNLVLLMGLVALFSFGALAYDNYKLREGSPTLRTISTNCGVVLVMITGEDGMTKLRTSKCGSWSMDVSRWEKAKAGADIYYARDLRWPQVPAMLCFDSECHSVQ